MATYYSSDFGWLDGQDISDEFATLVKNTLQPGDTLVLEGMYKISGEKIQLPDGFTLSAVQGAGLDIVDTHAYDNPLLLMGNGGTIDNVTFTASESPNTGYEGVRPQPGVDFHKQKAVGIKGVDNVTISNSDFSGNLEVFLDVHFSDGLVIEGTHFEGSVTQVRLIGDTKDVYISGSHFEDALADGIKTLASNGYGVQRVTVVDSLFEGANRDGIDTTGGFKDSLVSNTVFYGNRVSALDIKTYLERTSDISPEISNSGIRIEDSQIIGSQNGVVVTMLDKLGVLTAANADELMPHDIQVVNTIFENIGKNAFFVKDGYNITWTDLTFLGNFNELRLLNAEAPDGWTAYNVEGSVSTQGAPRNLSADDLWTNDVGPVPLTQTEPTSGDDILVGTNSADNVSLLEGDDNYTALGGNDTLFGGLGNDTLLGGIGADQLYGAIGNDLIKGNEDDDTLWGHAGNDSLYGGLGNDKLWGGTSADYLFGAIGDDFLKGNQDNDILLGGAGNDSLYGGLGNDTLLGGTGADYLFGAIGNDVINGDSGNDTLTGDAGNDLFVFVDGFGDDIVTDFDALNNLEKIDLSAVSSITSYADLTNPGNPHMTQVGSDVVIDDFAGNTITLVGVDLPDLHLNDFVF